MIAEKFKKLEKYKFSDNINEVSFRSKTNVKLFILSKIKSFLDKNNVSYELVGYTDVDDLGEKIIFNLKDNEKHHLDLTDIIVTTNYDKELKPIDYHVSLQNMLRNDEEISKFMSKLLRYIVSDFTFPLSNNSIYLTPLIHFQNDLQKGYQTDISFNNRYCNEAIKKL